ncbi:MAG: hypothetical protein RJA49_1520 [Actinomycetota bacterium]|jgi:cell wall-associated NlpC family hydrolase
MNRSRAAVARAITATALVFGLFSSFGVVPGARADGVSDQKQKIEQLAAELTNLNERIAVLDEEYGAALDQKAALDTQIVAAQAELAVEQKKMDQLQGVMSDIAVQKFVGNNTHNLSPLFSSAAAYSSGEQKDALSNIAFDAGAGNADDLQSLIRKVNKDTKALQAQQQQAADLITTLDGQRQQGAQLIAEYTQKAADAKAKYGELVQQEADRQAAAAAERAAATATAASLTGDSGSSNGGGSSTVKAPRGSGGSTSGNNGGNSGGGGSSSSGGGQPSLPVPPPSGKAGIAVSAAHSMLGVPYVAFEASPSRGFDCSGLTSWAWAQAGVYMPHQSRAQYATFPHVGKDQAQPGDLVFFYNPIHHVGIYVGGGMMIDAPHTGATVRLVAVKWGSVVGVARPG